MALHAISAETGGMEVLKTRLEERDAAVKGWHLNMVSGIFKKFFVIQDLR